MIPLLSAAADYVGLRIQPGQFAGYLVSGGSGAGTFTLSPLHQAALRVGMLMDGMFNLSILLNLRSLPPCVILAGAALPPAPGERQGFQCGHLAQCPCCGLVLWPAEPAVT